ncbi:MAG: cupredoxin domain-containing protein [Chloroflexota bacterium]
MTVLVARVPDASAADAQVVIVQATDDENPRYDPSRISVTAGSTVTWLNQSAVPVTVTSADGLFDSDLIPPGGSFSVVFSTPGSFRYFCVPNPSMKGTVNVAREKN